MRLPFDGNYRITQDYMENPNSGYNCSPDGSHNGIDYATPTGIRIYPICSGKVIFAGLDNTGYGRNVRVLHDDGYMSLYAHLSIINCKVEDVVGITDYIGLSGGGLEDENRGNSSGAHLHLEVRSVPNNCRTHINPLKYIENNIQKIEYVPIPNTEGSIEILEEGLRARADASRSAKVYTTLKKGDILIADHRKQSIEKDGVRWFPCLIPVWVAEKENNETYIKTVQ